MQADGRWEKRFWFSAIIYIFSLNLVSGMQLSSSKDAFQVTEIENSKIVFTLRPFEIQVTPLVVEKEMYHSLYVAGFGLSIEPGYPMLPQSAAVVHVPAGAEISVTLLESSFENLTEIHLQPAPEVHEDLTKGEVSYTYKMKSSIYHSDTFWPAELAKVSERGRWRNREIARIQINPIQYNHRRKTLRVYNSIKIQVSFSKPLVPESRKSERRTGIFDRLTESFVLNARFQRESDRLLSSLVAQGPSRYNPQATYYKLLVEKEGIYALS